MANENSVPLSSGQGTVVSVEDFGTDSKGDAKRWKAEIDSSRRTRNEWRRKAEKVIARYQDQRDTLTEDTRRFNILWSNVQVMKPACYAKPPKPEVSRKYDTTSPPNRVAATIFERNLDYFVCEHSIFDAVMNQVVLDRFLSGQGTAWIRYDANLPDAKIEEAEAPEPGTPEDGMDQHANVEITDDAYEVPTEETICYDYVHWQDWLCSPARVWEEVTWVARRVYMTQDQGVKRFGEDFKKVPLSKQDANTKTQPGNKEFGPGLSVVQKAAVWEIWDKEERQVYWINEDYGDLLDEKEDILELSDFFPCPKPLLATTTNESIIPIPDYVLYQDQAQELDQATNRISLLMAALKIIGVYDKSQDGVQRLLTEGVDNVMIPVDNWGMFAERGGLKGTVDFFPVQDVMNVLTQLIQDRNVIKQDIYEITGIADIVRGASVASETATAQSLKAKFAGIRINDTQKDIARFTSDLLNMSGEILTNFFQPETLVSNADIDPSNPDFQYVPQAIALIKNRALVKHRISVSTDAITDQDDKDAQEARVGFITSMGQFLQSGMQAAEAHPEIAPMLGQVILWGARGFKVGRDMEGTLEQMLTALQSQPPPQPQPSPEQMKAQGEQQRMQLEMQMKQADGQMKVQEGQQKMQLAQQEMQLKMQEAQLRLEAVKQEAQIKVQTLAQEGQLKLQMAQQEHAMKLSVMEQELVLKMKAAGLDQTIQVQQAQTDQQITQNAHNQDVNQQNEQHALAMTQAEQQGQQQLAQQKAQVAVKPPRGGKNAK